jgi:sugar O-acyltransferase (sialic acid O-acetyltransferase NeuD family)
VHVIVVGGAAHGRQVIDAIEARGEHTIVGILDRALKVGDQVRGYAVLGDDEALEGAAGATGADGFVVAIGDNFTRDAVIERELGASNALTLASVTHPAAIVARDAEIGAGSVLLAGSIVGNGARVGRGALLGVRASLDHDGEIANAVSLGPGATTGGTVRIGRASAIGLGANIMHGVVVGAHTVVGAGALVLDDVPDGVVAFGVPARVVRRREPGEPYLRRA